MPRLRQFRENQQANAGAEELVIPDKLYFRIREVSRLTQTKPYVLRYWETEFPTLNPAKSRSRHRLYRREDIEMVLEIRRLLYEKGFTIEGARKQLAGNTEDSPEQKKPVPAALDGSQLRAIKRELQSILTILSRKC